MSFNTTIHGQQRAKEQINLIIKAKEPKPVMILGPSGYGKTQFALYAASLLRSQLIQLNCAYVRDLNSFLRSVTLVESNQVLFLDEIHCMPKDIQEAMYSIIDYSSINIDGEDISLPRFRIFGATTHEGKLNEALRNRFTFTLKLTDYELNELAMIIRDYCLTKYSIIIDEEASIKMAKMSRGCPRIAKNRVEWLASMDKKVVDLSVVEDLRKLLDIDNLHLEKQDREYIKVLMKSGDRPVSLKNLSQKLKMDEESVQETIESYLISRDLITITSRGRCLNLQTFRELKNANSNN